MRLKFFNSTARRQSLLQWLFWFAMAAYYPMIVVYLRHKGYTNTTIGTIIAVNSMVVIFAQPFWGMVSDRIRSIKRVFILCFCGAVLLFLTLPLFKAALFTGIVFAAITFFECGMFPLLDNWIYQGLKKEGNDHFGRVRMFGSMGFAISVIFINLMVEKYSIYVIFPIFLAAGAIVILWAARVKDFVNIVQDDGRIRLKPLLKNSEYVILLVFGMILFAPFRGAFIFLANAIEQSGGSQAHYGIAFSVTALSEILVFFYSSQLTKRFKPGSIILIACLFFIGRQFIYYYAQTPLHFILAQSTQGLTYGLFLTGCVHYVDSMAPDNLKSTAQTVATAVYFGTGGILGSLWGGWAIDNIGLKNMYKIGIIVTTSVSALFFVYQLYLYRKRALTQSKGSCTGCVNE